jgi:hypothetical protein
MKILKFIAAALLIVSCSKQELFEPQNAVQISIIDQGTYFYSDIYKPELGWEIKKNGDMFSYDLNDEQITIISDELFQEVLFYSDAMDTNPVVLESDGISWIVKEVQHNNIFKIKFETPQINNYES